MEKEEGDTNRNKARSVLTKIGFNDISTSSEGRYKLGLLTKLGQLPKLIIMTNVTRMVA